MRDADLSDAGVRRVPGSALDGLEDHLVQEGWKVYRLASGVRSEADFFRAAIAVLPTDPPYLPHHNLVWDALDDCISSGLIDTPDQRIAIVWPDPYLLQAHDPKAHEIAESILTRLPPLLADSEMTCAPPKEVLILLGSDSSKAV